MQEESTFESDNGSSSDWGGLFKSRITRREALGTIGKIVIIVGGVAVVGGGTAAYLVTRPKSVQSTTSLPNNVSGTLIMGYDNIYPNIDPAMAPTNPKFVLPVYERLLTYEMGTTNIIPQLATALPEVSQNGTVWTFSLQKDVKFHDGTDFDANAVKVSMQRAMAVGTNGQQAFPGFQKVDVIDPNTVSFTFQQANSAIVSAFASSLGLYIVSPTAINKNGGSNDPWAQKWFTDNAVGTGPYKLTSFVENQSIEYEAFPEYWRGWGGKHVAKIVGTNQQDESTEKLNLLSGQIDLAESLLIQDADQVGKTPGFVTAWPDTLSPGYFLMNKMPGRPLADKNLRLAVSYAFDYQAAVSTILLNHWRQQQGPLPYSALGHNNSLTIYQKDINRASGYLSDAGYKAGELTLSLLYNVYGWKAQLAQLLQSNLNDIGINLQITVVQWPQMWNGTTDPNDPHDLYLFWPTANINDPITFLEPLLASWSIKANAGTWNKGYNNSTVDSLITQAKQTTDQNELAQLVSQIQTYPVNDAESIYLFDWPVPTSWSTKLQNIKPSPLIYGEYDYYQYYKQS